MACNCTNTECMEVYLVPCAETITLPLEADEDAVWKMVYEFNGQSYRADIIVTTGNPIIIPNRFNEDYRHKIRFFKTDGTVFNDTCYILKTMPTIFTDSEVTGELVFNHEITAPGSSFSDIRMIGKEVMLIATEAQDYNNVFWSKPISGQTLTSTQLSFYVGQIVTVTLKH